MLKKAWILTLLMMHGTTFANQTIMQFGSATMSNASIHKLHHSGSLTLDKVKVADSTLVNGSLTAKNSEFHELTVNGSCSLDKSELLSPVSISGSLLLTNVKANGVITVFGALAASHTVFTKPITVKSTKTDFVDSKLESITIGEVSGHQTQSVNLTNSSVNGDITFVLGKGIVKMDQASSIKGKVHGGTIEKVVLN